MHARLAGFPRDDLASGLEILHATCHVGVTGSAGGLPVALVIHRPHVEPVAVEHVHQRVLALARHRQVKAGLSRDRRPVNQEEHGQRLLAGLRRAEPLAIHGERDIAFPCRVLRAPQLCLRPRAALSEQRRPGPIRESTEPDPSAHQHRAPRYKWHHREILTRVTALTKLLASTKSPSRVTEVLRTMLPPPGIAQLWNFSILGSKRTIVFGVDPDSLYQMMSLITEMP